MKLKPSRFFLIALALSTALFIAAHEAHSPTCQTGSGNWFGDVFWVLGPAAVAAVIGGMLSYGYRERLGVFGNLFLAGLIAGVWTLVGLYIIFVLLIGHCLDS